MTAPVDAPTEFWRQFEPLSPGDAAVARACEGALANLCATPAAGPDRLAAASSLARVLAESDASALLVARMLGAISDDPTRAAFVEALVRETRNAEHRRQAHSWAASWVRLGADRAALSVVPLTAIESLWVAEAIDIVANALARAGVRRVILEGPDSARASVTDALALVGIVCISGDRPGGEEAPRSIRSSVRPWWRSLW